MVRYGPVRPDLVSGGGFRNLESVSPITAIILGAIQGLTEFLPISSTAHLLIVPLLLGQDDPGAAYSAVIQCGTLLAVIVAMRRDIAALAAGFARGLREGKPLGTPESRVAVLVIVGTIPIVAAGFSLKHLIRGEARRPEVVLAAVCLGTLLLAAAELVLTVRGRRGSRGRDGLAGVTLLDGLTMGLFQVLALLPGTSRSGATIASGIFTGLDRRTAARFSFLLSLPAVAAAGILEAWQERRAIFGTPADAAAAAIGTLTAAVVGYAAIRWLLSSLTRHTLWPFVIYRLVLAGFLAAWVCGGLASPEVAKSSGSGESSTSSASPAETISRPVT